MKERERTRRVFEERFTPKAMFCTLPGPTDWSDSVTKITENVETEENSHGHSHITDEGAGCYSPSHVLLSHVTTSQSEGRILFAHTACVPLCVWSGHWVTEQARFV